MHIIAIRTHLNDPIAVLVLGALFFRVLMDARSLQSSQIAEGIGSIWSHRRRRQRAARARIAGVARNVSAIGPPPGLFVRDVPRQQTRPEMAQASSLDWAHGFGSLEQVIVDRCNEVAGDVHTGNVVSRDYFSRSEEWHAAQLLALIAPCRTATLRVPGTRTPPANICTHEGARGRHGLGRPVH